MNDCINTQEELQIFDSMDLSPADFSKPSVEIVKSISFQKFRYAKEARPGKKYQEKDFITLKLNKLKDQVIRVLILCLDAENYEIIHPNGLIGCDCHDDIFDKTYAVTKDVFEIVIPYIRIVRMKTKKEEFKNIPKILMSRAAFVPSPYKERFVSQCKRMMDLDHSCDTKKVCLGVIVTVEKDSGGINGTLHAVSNVIRNASEKTTLEIHKLSKDFVPAMTGGPIDIFTTEKSPVIEEEEYIVYVSCDLDFLGIHWESDKYLPTEKDLLYKRIISYQVPPLDVAISQECSGRKLKATLHLLSPGIRQHCTHPFSYILQTDVRLSNEKQSAHLENNIPDGEGQEENFSPKESSPFVYPPGKWTESPLTLVNTDARGCSNNGVIDDPNENHYTTFDQESSPRDSSRGFTVAKIGENTYEQTSSELSNPEGYAGADMLFCQKEDSSKIMIDSSVPITQIVRTENQRVVPGQNEVLNSILEHVIATSQNLGQYDPTLVSSSLANPNADSPWQVYYNIIP